MERIVKGIWIPIEIWQAEDLSWNEKILLMEVDSFTQKGRECYISNEYIGELLGVAPRTASRYLSNLIDKGLVRLIKFDGRARYVESALKNWQGRLESYGEADLPKMAKQTRQNWQGTNSKDTGINRPKEKSINTPKEKYNFRNSLIAAGVSEATADQWLAVRAAKKLVNTELALKATMDEIRKSGHSAEQCIRECVIRSWGGFKAEWLEREESGGSRGVRPEQKSNMQVIWERLQARENGTYNPNDLPDDQ